MTKETTTTALATAGNGAPSSARTAYRPDVDIQEDEREAVLVVDLPGARAESIDVRCENGVLELIARVEPRDSPGRRYLLREYGVGDFYRSFQLDERIDTARITGDYANGVLTLHLPKVEAAQPTKVAIRAG